MNLNQTIKKLSTIITRIERYETDKKTNEFQFIEIEKKLQTELTNYEKIKVELTNILDK